ncbi:MAG: MBL fold metallo-hydrolase RNA specificity domain-containing protein [Oscillospiraceae bacterium]|jgi:metallo-beta-lactamase family protein
MKLQFIGAAHEVTGSCHYLNACGKHILVDYGMRQGKETYAYEPLPVGANQIDYVLLTHAHIDHSGLLPLLYANGFQGQVFTTKATADLCNIMLKDSAHIQEFEAEWRNRKRQRSGKEEYIPLYTMDDALGVLETFVSCDYGQIIELVDGVKVRFCDVGHLLGSASIELWITEEGVTKKIVFSGDVGNLDQPLIKDPTYLDEADYAVIESTYGDRNHDKPIDFVTELVKVIEYTLGKGGNLVIPSFAVGRTQELLYFIRKIKADNMISFDFDVYIDSPLAIEATTVFSENVEDYYDEEAMDLINRGISPMQFPGLKTAVSSEESKAINFDPKPKVIISAAGMCEAGRIRHHLKHNLWRPECTILFVGYQAEGTLGRSLVDGLEQVTLFGESILVRARVMELHGISGHADQTGLIRWLTAMENLKKVFVVHGEDTVTTFFAEKLRDEYGYNAQAPFSGSEYDLAAGCWITQKQGVFLEEKSSQGGQRAAGIFARLVAAGQRLMAVINHNKGGSNKELSKFADQINALCDKWDR